MDKHAQENEPAEVPDKDQQQEKPALSPAQVEQEQEDLLMSKYGMKPRPKLIHEDHRYFDSADWAMYQLKNKSLAGRAGGDHPLPEHRLQPKLEPPKLMHGTVGGPRRPSTKDSAGGRSGFISDSADTIRED